jgi:hypothetical protein
MKSILVKKLPLVTAVFLMFSGFEVKAQVSSNTQSTIGARHGTSYSVVSTRYVFEANPAYCGYNDLSIPNQAKFKIETLRYEQYDNGKFIKSWTEERKTFEGCFKYI